MTTGPISSSPGTLPFRLNAAYGVAPRPQIADFAPSGNAPRIINQSDTVELTSAKRSSAIDALVAGRVDSPIDFGGAAAPAARGAISMYRHPADRNAAATAVNIGRSVDVTG